MNKKELKRFKVALEQKRDSIINAGKKAHWENMEDTGHGDFVDQASDDNEVHVNLRLLQIDAKLLRAIEEANMLETPLLERNLIMLTTIASIGTMVGLTGTTIGMIRSFKAMAQSGMPDATQLALGISEALINTAGGLICAQVGIVAYNYFVTRVDNFTYAMHNYTTPALFSICSRAMQVDGAGIGLSAANLIQSAPDRGRMFLAQTTRRIAVCAGMLRMIEQSA